MARVTYRRMGESVTLPADVLFRIRPRVEGVNGIVYKNVSLFMADVLDSYQIALGVTR
jgi:hypothetical protein